LLGCTETKTEPTRTSIQTLPRLRYQSPDRLLGATDFSKDDELRGSLNAVKLLKSQRWVWDDLRAACEALESGYARKREPGHWELAAVAFIASRQIDIQPWWDESTDELWRECGFAGKPPYMRVWRRLRELETVCEAFLEAAGTGAAPETAIGDRGLTISTCFEHATTNGTAPIFPWRQHGKNKRKDKLAYDRHGVMRCKHCGGPMSQVKFSQNNGKPRLWFRCMIGRTTDCAKDQTISCSTDWRSLIPLARTEPLYHELKESHKTYEAVHDYWRDRYRVAGDSLANRPKVVSLEWHRLRANVACLIDWLRIAKKNAWLVDPNAGRSASATYGSRRFKKRGENAANGLAKRRVRMGIAQPYGPQAAKLGIGKASLPSERYKGDPPNQVSLDLPGP
jgi:hypothetical protein